MPTMCWLPSTLEFIASVAGKFIFMDKSTTPFTKGRVVHVAVVVDYAKPLVPGTYIELEGLDLPVSSNGSSMNTFTHFVIDAGVLAIAFISVSPMPFPLWFRMLISIQML